MAVNDRCIVHLGWVLSGGRYVQVAFEFAKAFTTVSCIVLAQNGGNKKRDGCKK